MQQRGEGGEEERRVVVHRSKSAGSYRVTITYISPDTGRWKGTVVYLSDKANRYSGTTVLKVAKELFSKGGVVTLEDIHRKGAQKHLSGLLRHYLKMQHPLAHLKKKKGKEGKEEEKKGGECKEEGDLPCEVSRVDPYTLKKIEDPPRAVPLPEPVVAPKGTDGRLGEGSALPAEERVDKETGLPLNPLLLSCKEDLEKVAISLPKPSALSPEETGVTYGLIGKSFSGKTHFIAQELNKLSTEEIERYNVIIFFTESTSADPLRHLNETVRKRLVLVDRFCPRVLRAIKKINNETHNLFKFLVIFDDILELRGPLLTKAILTLRNANISSIYSIQHEKLLNPAQRSSLHNMYIFNLRTESWEFMLRGFLLGNMREILPTLMTGVSVPGGGQKKRPSICVVAQTLRDCLDPYIIHYDQRRDIVTVYRKFD